ncbi:hypothetical protein AKO1_001793 [Acrasis kona]|uniref:MYND-type domain-containing protein n=1 Tax=Acrasis kona TaxID=1008807 RepID=A0AAW2Z8G8_9EUKA
MGKNDQPEHFYDSSDDELFEDGSGEEVQDRMQRIMMSQFDRSNDRGPSKEAKQILKNIESEKSESSNYANKSYKLMIYLKNIRPKVWRSVIVPGSITLRTLHDKVLAPAMGWCRNYHAYYFRLYPKSQRRDGKVGPAFGNTEAQSVDVFHVTTSGVELLDDKNIKLCQLVREVGQKLVYMYDLGDSFLHKIIVEEINTPTSTQIGVVELVDGEGRVPPEDCGGIYQFAEYLDAEKKGSGKKFIEFQKERQNCLNSSFAGKEFSINRQKIHVQHQLKTALSKQDDSNMVSFSFSTGVTTKPDLEGLNYMKRKKICAVCNKGGDLKACSLCHIVLYCSKEHQVEDWNKHKKECRRIVN